MIRLAPSWFDWLSESHQCVLVSMVSSRNAGSTPTISENSGSYAYKTQNCEKHENEERRKRVTPRAAKRLWEFMREVAADFFAALRIGAVDAPVRADDETVEIIHQSRIAGFGARDREIGSRAAVNAAEFANFFTPEAFQRCVIQ
jgi:hypothetical protein